MRRVQLSPEATGTLLAIKCLATIRFYEPDVAAELTAHGLTEIKDGLLIITQAGKVVRLEAEFAHGDDAVPLSGFFCVLGYPTETYG